MIDTTSPDYAANRQIEERCKRMDWYAIDAFWGTSEERNLVDYIFNNSTSIMQKYDKFCLLRNEEVYKIYDFKTGEGFQPDFLLLLHGKEGNSAYYQVFIEPKGEHLIEKDAWKEEFLLEISKKYGIEKPFVQQTDKYVLYGLPFYNATDNEKERRFKQSFKDILKIEKNEQECTDLEETELAVADYHEDNSSVSSKK